MLIKQSLDSIWSWTNAGTFLQGEKEQRKGPDSHFDLSYPLIVLSPQSLHLFFATPFSTYCAKGCLTDEGRECICPLLPCEPASFTWQANEDGMEKLMADQPWKLQPEARNTPKWAIRQHLSCPERSPSPPLSLTITVALLSPAHTHH